MIDIPMLRIELEGVKHSVRHAFSARNDEINALIWEELDKVLSEQWIHEAISKEIRKAVEAAVSGISDSYALRVAISDAMVSVIADKVNDGRKS